VEVTQLIEWARDGRILSETWVFCVASQRWLQAAQLPELRELVSQLEDPDTALAAVKEGAGPQVRPGALRRIKVLSELNDEQLGHFAKIGEVVRCPAFTPVVRVGSVGDAIYFVLDGQVRLKITVRNRELLISVQDAGGVFGQISLFDGGPRVTDVVTDAPCVLFRVPSQNFRKLCLQRPDIATIVLLALGRTLATRIRTDDRHLMEMVALNQATQ